ncbi:MAG: branched-chain amino acid ABC transporter permease [Dehalococcoidia bacterium]|jgi:branched-chain amino acid transport system permease protein|nr:branched-chain amino acid ABC transporter permease [Dehalococcoidia bacterium]
MGIISAYIGRAYKGLRGEVLVLPSRTIVLLFCLTLLLLPLVMDHPYYLGILFLASIFAILAASWDLLSGFTGQMNFGHALFFGVAAYTAALLNLHFGLAPWLTIPLGALAAVLAGLIVGVPCLRLRGIYLALATLAFPLILTGFIFVFPGILGGEMGVSGIDPLSGSRTIDYYIAVTLMIGLGFVMWKITASKTGLIFHAIREDEVTARASGINTTRYKLLAFCLSGFFAGIAGGLYVHYMKVAGPSTLELLLSFQVVIWAIFGGIATIYGPIAGVFILYIPLTLLESVPVVSEIRMLLMAIIVVLAMLFMPEGLTTWVRDKIEKVCPRCKIRNLGTRKSCRVCRAELD